ncbi:hypothetical protein [Jiangella asiatica]|uniref:Uncharacterized protein n=1 Tax=Jiangella asiatica TaxID=2530372 RepID=A0A4R5CVB9_9ACTN|nr:hypothetical protein [Jiangella asiatica]TDE03390.1 hypothetical protein E1269_20335 [Jiangella asiatica]
MTGRFDRPGLLGTVTAAAVLDGTPRVIRNVVTHAVASRRPLATAQPVPSPPSSSSPAVAGRPLLGLGEDVHDP